MYVGIDRELTLCPKAAALLSIPEEWSSIDILKSRHSALLLLLLLLLLSLPLCFGNKHKPSTRVFPNKPRIYKPHSNIPEKNKRFA